MSEYHLPVLPPAYVLEWLKQAYKYDAATGDITHIKSVQPLRGKNRNGYTTIIYRHLDESYSVQAHHVAWFLYNGEWPAHQLDHINRVKTDNRIDNLRQVDSSTNNKNRRRYRRAGTGVSFNKRSGKYHARWRLELTDTQKHLGYFNTEQEALNAVAKYINTTKNEK